jgi:hypothetical protein
MTAGAAKLSKCQKAPMTSTMSPENEQIRMRSDCGRFPHRTLRQA